jgi:hypothetical protein
MARAMVVGCREDVTVNDVNIGNEGESLRVNQAQVMDLVLA